MNGNLSYGDDTDMAVLLVINGIKIHYYDKENGDLD